MKDLYDWLSQQHHGLRTFKLFRQKNFFQARNEQIAFHTRI
jgi:hypothetical protein